MIGLAFKYYIQRFIHTKLLSRYSVVNFDELKTYSKKHHVFITGNITFLGPYNSESPYFGTTKPYVTWCNDITMTHF